MNKLTLEEYAKLYNLLERLKIDACHRLIGAECPEDKIDCPFFDTYCQLNITYKQIGEFVRSKINDEKYESDLLIEHFKEMYEVKKD